jgi:RNA polymerase-interacting CarD/CdnL/TRCF family regulator
LSAIKVAWKRSKTFTILTAFQFLIALFFAGVAFFLSSIELQMTSGGLAVVFASIASSTIRDMVDKQKIDQILDTLSKIEGLQEEIQKEQKEQSEQRNSIPQIIPTLQALTQYYSDFINKQKREDNI